MVQQTKWTEIKFIKFQSRIARAFLTLVAALFISIEVDFYLPCLAVVGQNAFV